MREKLIELMCKAKLDDPETGSWTEWLADYLLQHGVVVLQRDGNEFNLDLYCPYCGMNLSVTDALERK